MITSIRNLDQAEFQRFKAEAKRREQTLGEAFTQAMRLYRTKHPKTLRLADLPTENWGPGSEDTSRHVDEIAYGNTNRH